MTMQDRLAWLIGTWFGCGLVPKAPGTAGTLGGWVIAAAAAAWLGWGRGELIAATVLILPLAVWSAGRIATSARDDDPQQVVVDEVAGLWLALWGATSYNWKSAVLAFGLFRLFDIWKPFPARRLEALPGGLGIVADDLAAGIWAALVLRVAGWFNLY